MAQATDDEHYGPIADFAAPEPADPSARARRRSEGKRYDGRRLKEDPVWDVFLISGA
ncbi:MAG TPA: hypothetical protein VF544_08685 [Pyrinomonadaceae bacterium]